MEIYDTANRLAQEIKQSEEYKAYKTAKENIKAKPELKQKMDEFEKARYEAQVIALQTGTDDAETMKPVHQLYGELIQNEEASKFFDAEIKFNVMITDVNRIIGEAVQEVMK